MTTDEAVLSFHKAVIANDENAVRKYLHNGGDISARSPDRNAYTALHWAAQEGHVDMVRLLLGQGANPNVRSSAATKGATPLTICSARNEIGVADLLLKGRADPNIANSYAWTPLHNASDYGHVEFVKMLLDHGANIEARNERKCTPLHCAALKCQTRVVCELLNRGADVNAKGLLGVTPLWFAGKFAARHGNAEELCTILLEHGAVSHPFRVALEGSTRQVLRVLVLLAPLLAARALGLTVPGWGLALYIVGAVAAYLVWARREGVA
jgi:cytohesin